MKEKEEAGLGPWGPHARRKKPAAVEMDHANKERKPTGAGPGSHRPISSEKQWVTWRGPREGKEEKRRRKACGKENRT